MHNVKNHLDLLGHRVRDKVTGLKGVVDSLSFDLYGCIQASVNPGIDEKDEQKPMRWHDVSRLEVTSKKPVMDQPDFENGKVAEGLHGPAEKAPMY